MSSTHDYVVVDLFISHNSKENDAFIYLFIYYFFQETKSITHRSLKLCSEAEQHMRDIVEVLRKDRRYLVLECQPDERSKILMAYMEELEKRGPPPPPTASEPTRRK